MAKRPRFGSLQFWPRKRAEKIIPSVNWSTLLPVSMKDSGLMGFIGYKAAMATVIVKDETPNSMTKGKRIAVPVTILETPIMKVFSVRFYKFGKVTKEVVVANDKELKKVVRVPKTLKALDSMVPKDFDDMRVIVYTLVKNTSVKKSPDLIELAIGGQNKLDYVKSIIGKDLTIKDFVDKHTLVDVRGLTKGKGLVGPIKRFGLTLKSHKSEKGVRRPGSLGPWHPARVTFHTPISGQMGMFTRVHYNQKVIGIGNVTEKDINPKEGFKHYGRIKGQYIILKGSVQGPVKRQILITPSFRPTKIKGKIKFELVELIA